MVFLLKVFVFLQNRYFFFVYCFFTIFLKQNNVIVSRCLISKLLFFYFFFRFSLFLSMKMWVGFFFNICLKFTPNICYLKEILSSKWSQKKITSISSKKIIFNTILLKYRFLREILLYLLRQKMKKEKLNKSQTCPLYHIVDIFYKKNSLND